MVVKVVMIMSDGVEGDEEEQDDDDDDDVI